VNRAILFINDLISELQLKNKTSINLRGFSNSESIKAFKAEASLLELITLKVLTTKFYYWKKKI